MTPDDTAARLAQIEAALERNRSFMSGWIVADYDFLLAEVRRLQTERNQYAEYEAGWEAAEHGSARDEARSVEWLNGWEHYQADEQIFALTAERDRLQAENAALRETICRAIEDVALRTREQLWAREAMKYDDGLTHQLRQEVDIYDQCLAAARAAAQPEEPR